MKKQVAILAIATLILSSCEEEKTLEALLLEKTELQKELAAINEQIEKLDTVQTVSNGLLVSVEPVKIGSFVHQIEVQANLETDRDVILNAESGGLIQSVLVQEGQAVRKGQVLVQIDAEMVSSSIDELKSAIEFAEYNYKKQQELFNQNLGSEFQLEQAKNNLDNLKSRLSGLKTQKSKFSITAPFDGVVDEVFARVGTIAGPQSPVLRLVDNREIRIVSDVSERLFSRLRVGMPVAVQIPSLKDTIIKMNITNIGNYVHPTNRTFRVQAELKNNKFLLPNMLAKMKISDYTNEQAMLIPSKAILQDRFDKSYVYVMTKDDKGRYIAKREDVEVVESYKGMSEINPKSGIKQGDKIVVNGARGLSVNDYIRTK